jgi:inorganic pyrophosphatase
MQSVPLVLVLAFAAVPLSAQAKDPPQSTVPLAPGLSFADPQTIKSPKNFLRDHPASPGAGLINAVVEIPAGTNEKWEVKLDGTMRWDQKDGMVRTVKYLGYPGNYGMVPRTVLGKELGGDGDPLDVVVLGPNLPRGAVVPVRAIGTIKLIDAGDKDDKLLAVPLGGPLGDITDLAQLDAGFPGVTAILKTWFENYKGAGALQCSGFGDRQEAQRLIDVCTKSFANAEAAAASGAKK